MTVADVEEFFRRLAALAELFDAKSFSDAKAELYFEALRDLELAAVVQGMNQAAKTCTFMPRPAEIRALAIGDDEDRAERAWMLFKQAMRQIGGYASLAVQDPALAETMLTIFGSWPEACSAEFTPEMWASKRKEFGRAYRVLCGRGLVGARYLAGVCETTNAGKSEWMKHTPVGLIEGDTVTHLTQDDAERYRGLIAAQAHGFSRLEASTVVERKDESA